MKTPRTRIALGLTLVLAILVGSSALEFVTMRRFQQTGREIRDARDARAHARAFIPVLDEGWANDWAWQLTEHPAGRDLRHAAVARILPRMAHLRTRLPEGELAHRLDSLSASLRHFQATLRRTGGRNAGESGLPLMRRASAVLHQVEAFHAGRERAGEAEAEHLAERAATIALTAAMFAIGIGLILAYVYETDVARRLVAEQALRQSEAQFRTVVGVLAEGIVHIDRTGTVVGCNRAATEILGISAERILSLGSSSWHGWAEDGRQLSKEEHPALVTLRTGEAQRNFVWGLDLSDGRRRWLAINSEPVADDRGRFMGVVSSFSDITERRAAEHALREANLALSQARDDAEAASHAKSEFLANMSHELRTPLNSVIGFANVLRGNKLGNLMPDQLKYIERIGDNGRHLLSLINDVLDLSKVEAGRLELDVEDVALGPMIYQVLAQLEGQLRGKSVVLVSDVRADLQPVRADKRKLQQVLINLVGNAIKFTDEGSVTVRVISAEGGRPLRLDVTDTGIGIAADRQQAVFEAFRQADSTTTRKYGGTGLGLSITRSLLELMGYHITVASEPGIGSTFSVHFHAEVGGTDVRQAQILAHAA